MLKISGSPSPFRPESSGEAKRDQAIRQLASGVRLTSADVDPAALAMATRMTAQMRAEDQGAANLQDGMSLLQTADGALGQSTELLQRARELSVQAGNGTLTNEDRQSINDELGQITQQLDTIAQDTQFNTKTLLDGSQTAINVQSGAQESRTLSLPDVSSTALGVNALDAHNASASIDSIDKALAQVAGHRSTVGASINSMSHAFENNQVASQNMAAATSRLRDADAGQAMMQLVKHSVLSNAKIAMQAQVNQINADSLRFLR